MKLLTNDMRQAIREEEEFKAKINSIINADRKALTDFVRGGYQNDYKTREEDVAYDLSWNRCAKMFPKGIPKICKTCK